MKQSRLPYLLILPGLVYVALTMGAPLAYSFVTSLLDWQLTSGLPPRFVGLANYAALLRSHDFWTFVIVTVVFTVAAVGAETVLGVALGFALHRLGRAKRLLRIVFVLPMSVTPIVVGLMFLLILNRDHGILNYLLSLVGIPPNAWLANPRLALPSLVGVDVWEWTPLVLLATLAGLESLADEPVEAAMLDGVTPWQLARYIVLPLLAPALLVVVLTRALTALKVFDVVFVLTAGGPGNATMVLSYATYISAFQSYDFGRAGALSWCLVGLALIVTLPLVYILQREQVAA